MLAGDPGATLVAGASDLGVEANLKGTRFAASRQRRSHRRAARVRGDAGRACGSARRCRSPRLGGAGRTRRRPWPSGWQLFASPPIRNRATLGGNLATASPIGDGAPLLLALDAVVHIAGPGGRRRVPLASFFTGYRKTALQPGELLTTIEIPKPLPAALRFYKVSKRRLDDISTVAAAMAVDRRPVRADRPARASRSAAWPRRPVRVRGRRGRARGQALDAAAVDRVRRVFDETLTPIDDFRGSAAYRLAVSKRPGREVLRGSAGAMTSVGRAVPHESARGHVTGAALYTDDLLGRVSRTLLHAWPVLAPHAHARCQPPRRRRRRSTSRASSRC